MKTLTTLCTTLAIVGSIGCQSSDLDTRQPATPKIATSDKSRMLASAPSADLEKAVSGQTGLAFDLYRQLGAADQENLFFSPYSIGVALSMTYAGARSSTAQAFEAVFDSNLPSSSYHRAMNDLERQLTSRGQGAKAADGKAFRLTTANSIFAQDGYPIESPYLDTLAVEYGANVQLLDFAQATEPSRLFINGWVESKTENRIKDLLAEGTVTDETRLVLVNAVYFNAAWRAPFIKEATTTRPFHQIDGTTKQVATMYHGDLSTRAATVNGTEVFELPYDGNELSMLVIVPELGKFSALESALNPTLLASYDSALQSESLELRLPKFEMKTSAGLKSALSALGLGIAFSGNADFSGIVPDGGLAISDVVHQAFVNVNEAGTEAAAATAVIIGVTSLPPPARVLNVDRPFVFAIRDNATKAIVFVGRVTKL